MPDDMQKQRRHFELDYCVVDRDANVDVEGSLCADDEMKTATHFFWLTMVPEVYGTTSITGCMG